MLRVCYQNIRGLNSKILDLYLNSFSFDFDVIVFTETWLRAHISDSELFCNDFVIFRCDHRERIGGGVLIATKTRLNAELVHFDIPANIEFLCIKLNFNAKLIFFYGLLHTSFQSI